MTDASFLPDDYLAHQAEKRTNVISLTLFVVVMFAVFGAFLVTNRQWSQVKAAQASINQQFQDAAAKIEELNELEKQRERMLNKAEVAIALVERVPRSIMLAEFINRMPPRLSLLEFELKSVPVKPPVKPVNEKATGNLKGKTAPKQPTKGGATREEAMEERKVDPPMYDVTIAMVGLAPTDREVSQYIAELVAHPLLKDVSLKYSVQALVDEAQLQEFRVEMRLDPKADVRGIDPLQVPRHLRDPMSDEMRFLVPMGGTGGNTANATSNDREGR